MSETLLLNQLVARYALSFIANDMTVGVGTGSTSMEFLRLLSDRLKRGELRGVKIVPTSSEVEYYAHVLGIGSHVVQMWQVDSIDIAVDSADEIDRNRNLIKGAGGALTREKVVEYSARKFIVIANEFKLVDALGLRSPVPIEVLPFCWSIIIKRVVGELGGSASLRVLDRGKRGPVVTDNGNYIIDWRVGRGISNPEEIEVRVKLITGVVESGIFSGSRVHKVIIATRDGSVVEI